MTRRGLRLRALATLLYDAGTVERVIDPAIADLQHEPFSPTRYLAVMKVLLFCIPEVSMQMWTAVASAALAAVIVAAALELPALTSAWQQHALDLRMLLYLLPSTLPMAVAVGLTLGIASAGRRYSRRATMWVIATAMFASAISFGSLGWITPATNQVFRVMLSTRAGFPVPARGINELTFNEVRHQFHMANAAPASVVPQDLHWLAIRYYGIWAAALAPIAFACFGILLASLRSKTRWTMGAVVGVSYVAYLLYLTPETLVAVDGRWLGGAAWYPLIALAIVAVVVVAYSFVNTTSNAEVST